MIRIASSIWIAFGALLLLLNALNVFLHAAHTIQIKHAGATLIPMCSGCFGAIVGGLYVLVGVHSLQAKPKDMLGNGIGSIILGVLNMAPLVIALFGDSLARIIAGVVGVFCGSALMVAGGMALQARAEYREYRQALKGAAKPRHRPR